MSGVNKVEDFSHVSDRVSDNERGSNVLQLEYMIAQLSIKNYKGYYSKNELNYINPSNKECLLINLQNSTDGNGTHHLAVWKSQNDVRYFDSYGCPIPMEIANYYKNFHIQYFRSLDNVYPEKLIQKLGSDICGELCVLFLFLCPKFSYKQIIETLSMYK